MTPDTLAIVIAQYKYVVMAPAALLFGPIASLISGVLLRLNAVSLIPTCIALAGGELTGDVLWYWLGSRYGEGFVERFGRYFGITRERLTNAKKLFHRYHDPIILISKLTAGFGFAPAIFFTAGLSRVHFGRYMTLNLIGQVLWTSALLGIGFYVGNVIATARSVFDWIALAVFLVVIGVVLYGVSRYFKARMRED